MLVLYNGESTANISNFFSLGPLFLPDILFARFITYSMTDFNEQVGGKKVSEPIRTNRLRSACNRGVYNMLSSLKRPVLNFDSCLSALWMLQFSVCANVSSTKKTQFWYKVCQPSYTPHYSSVLVRYLVPCMIFFSGPNRRLLHIGTCIS